MLSENFGGRAFNFGLKRAQANFLHVSENDLTYKSGWDKKMLTTFKYFPELGQLSMFTPFSKKKMENRYDKITRKNCTIYITDVNVGTSSIFRRKIWDQGIRWRNFTQGGKFKFPADYAFSQAVLKAGYLVARTHENLVINNGHQIDEFLQNPAYYIENYKTKGQLQLLEKRLQNSGYRLKKTDTTDLGYEVVSIES